MNNMSNIAKSWVEAARKKGLDDKEIMKIMQKKGYPKEVITEVLINTTSHPKRKLNKWVLIILIDIFLIIVISSVFIYLTIKNRI